MDLQLNSDIYIKNNFKLKMPQPGTTYFVYILSQHHKAISFSTLNTNSNTKIVLFDHTCCCLWLTGCQLEAMAEAGSKFRWLSLTLPSPSSSPYHSLDFSRTFLEVMFGPMSVVGVLNGALDELTNGSKVLAAPELQKSPKSHFQNKIS